MARARRGWKSDITADFLPTNTFTNVALCNQTLNAPATGSCPAPIDVPCPK